MKSIMSIGLTRYSTLVWSHNLRGEFREKHERNIRTFLKEKAELRRTPFSKEEYAQIQSVRPRAERILAICGKGEMGLREAIAETK